MFPWGQQVLCSHCLFLGRDVAILFLYFLLFYQCGQYNFDSGDTCSKKWVLMCIIFTSHINCCRRSNNRYMYKHIYEYVFQYKYKLLVVLTGENNHTVVHAHVHCWPVQLHCLPIYICTSIICMSYTGTPDITVVKITPLENMIDFIDSTCTEHVHIVHFLIYCTHSMT